MTTTKQEDKERVAAAARDREAKERFLAEEQRHILHLTARILKRTVTDSDDAYAIALLAVSEAIDSYDASRGSFWSYAALVIRSRIMDDWRSQSGRSAELLVGPEAFGGDLEDEEEGAAISIRQEVQSKTAVYIDNGLRDELQALAKELEEYGVDLFDLPAAAPKSEKTKRACSELIRAFFLPPPLTEALRRTKNLPVKELLQRHPVSRKLIDRHRKFLLASAVIKAGDYQEIGEYIR